MANEHLPQQFARIADEIPEREVGPGCLLLFRIGRSIAHAGIVTEWPVFVHCHKKSGKVVNGVCRKSSWSARLVSVWRPNQSKIEAL
jgi:cell wall-associated NlpC family hydrolase